MNIFLIRHAESEQNVGLAKDTADSFVNITENGKIQAQNCAEFLDSYVKDNNLNLEKSVMFISPFIRTRQTAEILNKKLNIKDIRYDYLLIERIFGLFDNLSKKERDKFLKKNKAYNNYYSSTGRFYTKYPVGESVYDVVLRMKNFINFTLNNLDKDVENVFIITHGYALTAFVMAYFNYLPEWLDNQFKVDNCSVKLIKDNIDAGFIYGGQKE